MSCHDIGRGLNEVVRMTISLYNSKRIGLKEAKSIIATCAEAVNWCDGNSYEAVDYISGCTCGKCLKRISKGEKIYLLSDLPWDVNISRITMKSRIIQGCGLCFECFMDMIEENEELTHHKAVIDLLKSISDNTYEGDISTGIYEDNNNGCRWVREVDWFD